MRKVPIAGLVLLISCTTLPPNAGIAVPNDVSGREEVPRYPCRKPSDRDFVGQAATPELGARMIAQARARSLRWVSHGAVITMEYSPDRLTVRLDPQNRILGMSCG